jgi:choline dehydrogenase-like flavoprotein
MISLPSEVATVVVGSGTGGCAFTGVLAAHDTDPVLLVEAGPDPGSHADGRWPADFLDARTVPLRHDWGLRNADGLDLPRARVLGGCSAHNGCTASLGAREDYDDWARRGNPGWDSTTVAPLLHWVHERFRVRRYRTDELTVAQAAFVGAGLRTGLPFADDLDDLDAGVGIGPMPVNIVDGTRWNAGFAFLDPVRDAGHLRIAGDTRVTRILLERGRATGVEVVATDGRTHTVRAGRVVLAAGAYHSPALLLRSGIGPAALLRGLGIDTVADLPGVGANLLDHACVQLDFHGRDGLLDELASTPWQPDEQTVGRARSSRCDAGPYDIHVFMVAGANTGHPGLPPVSLYGGAMRAVSQGRVTLHSAAPDAAPVIDHRYGSDPDGHDRAVLTEALELLREMTADRELADVLGRPARTERDPLTAIASYCHPAGTCAMGPDGDPGAVVDPTGRVHGVHGLYVADASIMPAITRGNVNLPVAMIGARAAAGLLGLNPSDVPAPTAIPETASVPETTSTRERA